MRLNGLIKKEKATDDLYFVGVKAIGLATQGQSLDDGLFMASISTAEFPCLSSSSFFSLAAAIAKASP